jgi:hypothetical protein
MAVWKCTPWSRNTSSHCPPGLGAASESPIGPLLPPSSRSRGLEAPALPTIIATMLRSSRPTAHRCKLSSSPLTGPALTPVVSSSPHWAQHRRSMQSASLLSGSRVACRSPWTPWSQMRRGFFSPFDRAEKLAEASPLQARGFFSPFDRAQKLTEHRFVPFTPQQLYEVRVCTNINVCVCVCLSVCVCLCVCVYV